MRYLHFCPDFLVMCKNDFIRKLWLISKFVTSQTGKVAIYWYQITYLQWVKTVRDCSKFTIGKYHTNTMEIVTIKNACIKLSNFPLLTMLSFYKRELTGKILHLKNRDRKKRMAEVVKPSKAAFRRCSSKKVFFKILQYSQENTSVELSF